MLSQYSGSLGLGFDVNCGGVIMTTCASSSIFNGTGVRVCDEFS